MNQLLCHCLVLKQLYLCQCSSTFLSSWNPWYALAFIMEPPFNKNKKMELLVKKSNISLLDASKNKRLLQMLKSKKFNDLVILEFWNVATMHSEFDHLEKRIQISNIVSSHFLTLTIELHLVRFRLGVSLPFELRCSLPSTPSLLLLVCFT